MSAEKTRALTGDRPTGKLHLGHFVGSVQNRVKLQEEGAENFYMVADVQALTHNAENPEKVRDNIVEVTMDNLASGLDPAKTTLFVQSCIPEIAELTQYFLNLVTLARAERNPTVKDEMKQKGYGADVPLGFLIHPINQAADILIVKASTVPVGEDQLPILEQTNEIVHKFNSLYGEVFPKVVARLSEAPRLSGTDGKAKMSKSLGNAIFLADPADTVAEKVMQMYTDPNHIRAEDPGNLEGNTVFEYLDIFDSNKADLEELKRGYQKGGIGDVLVKKRLIEILNETLAPIREKRSYLEKNQGHVMDILRQGNDKVREIAGETMKEVRRAMKINYFN